MLESVSNSNINSSIENWIKNHKPTQTTAAEVYEAFIRCIKIEGSSDFILKTKKIIEKTSYLASGFTILQRMLSTTKNLRIVEGKKDSHGTNEISLSFQKIKSFDVTRNHEGDLELSKMPKISTFIHECLHHLHSEQDPAAKNKRLKSKSFLPEMDNQEEELTITGNLHIVKEGFDFCCENTALIELGRLCRINHRGISIPKNESLSLHDMVSTRAIANVKRALIDNPKANFYSEHIPKYGNKTPLDIAAFLEAIETDAGIQKEWLELIRLLLKAGFKSDHIFKIAILENSVELIELLIKAGIPLSKEILKLAIKENLFNDVEELFTLLQNMGCLPSQPSLNGIAYEGDTYDILESNYWRARAAFYQKFSCQRKISLKVVELLLKTGAEPSEEILEIAIQQKSLELIQLFINKGWKPSEKTWRYAIERYRSQIVQLFMKAGFEPPENALKIAIKTADLEMIVLLIRGSKEKPSDSLLILAAQKNNSAMIELLIREGAKITPELIERAKNERYKPHVLLKRYFDSGNSN